MFSLQVCHCFQNANKFSDTTSKLVFFLTIIVLEPYHIFTAEELKFDSLAAGMHSWHLIPAFSCVRWGGRGGGGEGAWSVGVRELPIGRRIGSLFPMSEWL